MSNNNVCYRGVREGHHGWTMLLKEENDLYEYAGYDYVMDLISEMELEPDFPHNWSYYVTGLMRPTEGSSVRRDAKKQYVLCNACCLSACAHGFAYRLLINTSHMTHPRTHITDTPCPDSPSGLTTALLVWKNAELAH